LVIVTVMPLATATCFAVTSVWIWFHVALRGRVELTHPRALTVEEWAERTAYLLKVFVPHFAVVPGWVVFGEIISQVEFSGSPGEVELALADSVFHPPIAHVEGFRKLLSHF
jgi:hypothetical protein